MPTKELQNRVRRLDTKLNRMVKVLLEGRGCFINLATKKDLAGELDSLTERLASIQDGVDGIASKLGLIGLRLGDKHERRASSLRTSGSGHRLFNRTRRKKPTSAPR